jgi:hypothetical protein
MTRQIATAAVIGALALGLSGAPAGAQSKSVHQVTHAKRLYPSNLRRVYMSLCTGAGGGGSKSTCACTLSYLEAHASLVQFKADTVAAGNREPKILKRAFNACT